MNYKNIIISLSFTMIQGNAQESGIFNNRSSRLGDNISGVLQAMWINHKYKIPYYYQWFVNSNQFKLHEKSTIPETNLKKIFDNTVYLKDVNNLKLDKKTLYMTNVFSNLDIDWYDTSFVQKVKEAFTPRYPIESPIKLPKNKLTVALHIRMGGGFDKIQTRKKYPFRFPEIKFYIDQLERIIQLSPDKPLYVHIFTDDQNPNHFKQLFEQQFGTENISFSCRQIGNKHDKNVLNDFFAMMNFDIIIRSGSLYSYYAWRLGNQKIMICPQKMGTFNKKTGYWSVEEVEVVERK